MCAVVAAPPRVDEFRLQELTPLWTIAVVILIESPGYHLCD
jgi:hypothetical protein